MKKYVFTVRDDVCAQNGKDANATALLQKMKEYGSVEDYETEVSVLKSDYDKTIFNLNAEYNKIKNLNLSEDEISILTSYRRSRDAAVAKCEAKVSELSNQLNAIKEENEQRIAKIKELLVIESK